MLKIKKTHAASLIAVLLSFASMSASATTINLNYNQAEFSTTKGQKALTGFQDAANYWSNIFTDDVDINLNIGFQSLGSTILGQTNSNWSNFYYQDISTALTGNQTSTADNTAVANLSCEDQGNTFCSRSFLDEEGGGAIDNDGSPDNYVMSLTQANAKALGFVTSSFGQAFSAVDAIVTFSSDFAFDFDKSDGVANDKIDFFGVAVHEIGHALGFTSGVDTSDNIDNNLGSPQNLDNFAVFSALDLFRYSDESVALNSNVLDLRPGADSYFSIDGGATSLGHFSTGVHGGDGNQASHWKDGENLGILDPTFAFGEVGNVSALDLTGFDVIGWDLAANAIAGPSSVPLPSSLGLFGLAFAGLMSGRKKQKLKV